MRGDRIARSEHQLGGLCAASAASAVCACFVSASSGGFPFSALDAVDVGKDFGDGFVELR